MTPLLNLWMQNHGYEWLTEKLHVGFSFHGGLVLQPACHSRINCYFQTSLKKKKKKKAKSKKQLPLFFQLLTGPSSLYLRLLSWDPVMYQLTTINSLI